MKTGTLVKHRLGYIGVVVEQGDIGSTKGRWLIHFSEAVVQDRWCIAHEVEVIENK